MPEQGRRISPSLKDMDTYPSEGAYMEVRVGDIYIRNSDDEIYRVKNIDNTMVILELEDGGRLTLTDIFGLKKAYVKKEPNH